MMIQKNIRNSIASIAFYILFGIVYFGAVLLDVLGSWVIETYGVSINEILYTVLSPLAGTSNTVLFDAWFYGRASVIKYAVLYAVYVTADYLLRSRGKTFGKVRAHRLLRFLMAVFVILNLISTWHKIDEPLKLTEYIEAYRQKSTLYEDYYVDPRSVAIESKTEKPRNLVYIVLESLETAYASEDEGGHQAQNYIPELTRLAKENLTFSNSDKLGGYRTTPGAGWTMSALFAQSTGLPFCFPVAENTMDLRKEFASGVWALGDILHEKGYASEFICGSDVTFAGRGKFYSQHGKYKLFDLISAREKGYIASDYAVWWGFEDMHLYRIAKDELKLLYERGLPFCFTMLTVDTHHIDGYVCSLCNDEYPDQLANVIKCADTQLAEFIDWLKLQPFYENTTVVIAGDHPRMDTSLVSYVEYKDRTVYNCILNSALKADASLTKNREFTTMDMFPTVLAAMGYDIEGERLGIGVNLFSGEKTLAELMGYEALCTEIQKYSPYYVRKFS